MTTPIEVPLTLDKFLRNSWGSLGPCLLAVFSSQVLFAGNSLRGRRVKI